MRDPARIARILAKLEMVWSRAPDQRLGQLYCNVMRPVGDVWAVEDDEFERNLDAWIEAHPGLPPNY
jgi:hypothetical protein